MSRDAMIRKIAALRKMTMGAGCSEAEALSAAQKAAELMKEAGLSEETVEAEVKSIKARTLGKGVRDPLWARVGTCTNTVPLFHRDIQELQFIGHAPGPEIAVYLYVVLNRAIDAAIRAFKTSVSYRRRKPANRRNAIHDFTSGMVFRLQSRLKEIFASVTSPEALGRALAATNTLFPTTTRIKAMNRKRKHNPNAFWAGHEAGSNVALSQGVAGQSTPVAALTKARP